MKQLKIGVVLCFVFVSLWSSFSQADTQFRIIVDASGSMQTSDPNKITAEALRLISDLAPENKATIGVWLFGEKPRVLFPESLITPSSKAKLANYVSNYNTEDLKTDLESILTMLLKTPDTAGLAPGFNREWILVTDGMVDISLDEQVNEASRQRIWGAITQQLEEKGIHLHTISLTGYTDKALLDHLSYRTNATHTEVAVPEDLLDTFDRIYSQASPAEELPLIDNGFDVDSNIDEVTFEMLHATGVVPKIIQPNGESLPLVERPGVHVSDAPHYTLVTVTQPEAGHWRVENVNLMRTQVRVLSSLVAKATKVAPLSFTKETIDSNVALFQDGIPVSEPDVLGSTTVTQKLSRIAGGSKTPVLTVAMNQVGTEYKSRIEGVSKPGLYELSSTIHGDTFSRKVRQYFTVQPAVHFDVKNNGANLITFSVSPTNAKLNASLSSVTLKLTYSDGSQKLESMPFISQGYWEKIVPISANAFVKASAELVGVTQTGEKLKYSTPIWTIERQDNDQINIQIGNLTRAQDEPNSDETLPQNQVVNGLVVPPNVDVVNVGTTQVQDEPVAQTDDKPNKGIVEKVTKEVTTMTQTSWFIYAVIGFVAFILILLVFIFSRRSAPRNRYQDEESDDV